MYIKGEASEASQYASGEAAQRGAEGRSPTIPDWAYI